MGIARTIVKTVHYYVWCGQHLEQSGTRAVLIIWLLSAFFVDVCWLL